jgi:1-acyl-sn-glycerol-3-phosphate acyltransferase
MKRILLMVFRNILLVPYMWIKLCHRAAHPENYTLEEHVKFLKWIVFRANKGGNVKIEEHGAENLPKENGFMFFPNHQGMFDVLAFLETMKRPFSLVFKQEVKDIILLKQIREALHYIPMDRSDLKQSMKVILEAAKRVKAGENFLIFAEGTRSRNGNEILPFKAGAFKAATKAKAPIVPVALLDSYAPFDTNSTAPAEVQIHYLKPMYYEEYVDMKTTEIALEVEKRIREEIYKHMKAE